MLYGYFPNQILLIFCLFMLSNCIQNTQPNEENLEASSFGLKGNTTTPTQSSPQSYEGKCSSGQLCSNLSAECLMCAFNFSCVYGAKINVTCTPKNTTQCIGDRKFERSMICRYCYQTDHWEHTCIQKANCNAIAAPKVYYRSNCSVKDDILCLGKPTFYKNLPCNWSSGYRWSTALILSITLGGFGADRFYLGHWQEGIGKVFSFGGLGVWTLIDVILISLRYLGPADGSLYI